MGDYRIIEAHATGIPTVRHMLDDALLPAPYFKDKVVDFQAILSSSSLLSASELSWLPCVMAHL